MYPSISAFLGELHIIEPFWDFPQYAQRLVNFDIYDIHGIIQFQATFYTDIIMMPEAAAHAFMAHALLVAQRAKKGKEEAVVRMGDTMRFKEEDKENDSWCF